MQVDPKRNSDLEHATSTTDLILIMHATPDIEHACMQRETERQGHLSKIHVRYVRVVGVYGHAFLESLDSLFHAPLYQCVFACTCSCIRVCVCVCVCVFVCVRVCM